jgi:hypothetical protein
MMAQQQMEMEQQLAQIQMQADLKGEKKSE